jgi:hypothetical protein
VTPNPKPSFIPRPLPAGFAEALRQQAARLRTWRAIGEADVPDLALALQFGERAHRLVKRHLRIGQPKPRAPGSSCSLLQGGSSQLSFLRSALCQRAIALGDGHGRPDNFCFPLLAQSGRLI